MLTEFLLLREFVGLDRCRQKERQKEDRRQLKSIRESKKKEKKERIKEGGRKRKKERKEKENKELFEKFARKHHFSNSQHFPPFSAPPLLPISSLLHSRLILFRHFSGDKIFYLIYNGQTPPAYIGHVLPPPKLMLDRVRR